MDESQEPLENSLKGVSKDEPAGFFQAFGPNFLAFIIGLTLAFFLQWELTDLVWSLWMTSLVVGYATILSMIGSAAWFGHKIVNHPDFESNSRPLVIAIGVGVCLFVLGFFSLHFCGFHAGHSVFLNQFLPVEGLPSDGFGNAFMNPILLWKQVFQYLMIPYGAFLIPAFIVERKHLIEPFRKVSKIMDEGGEKTPKESVKMVQDGMIRPYANVIRMHILIFFFAACHFLKVDSFLVYVVVSVVYFFPWSDLKAYFGSRKGASELSS